MQISHSAVSYFYRWAWFSHFTRYVEALQGVHVRFFFYLKWAIKQFLGGTRLKEISIKDHYKKIENHWIRWYLSTSDQQDLYFIGIKYYTLIEPHTTSTPHRALKKGNQQIPTLVWDVDPKITISLPGDCYLGISSEMREMRMILINPLSSNPLCSHAIMTLCCLLVLIRGAIWISPWCFCRWLCSYSQKPY